MTSCLAELEGREYMWQQYYSQLKQGTGCSQTGLGGWDGDGHGTSVKLGLWYLSAAGNRTAGILPTKTSWGHSTRGSHSHSR